MAGQNGNGNGAAPQKTAGAKLHAVLGRLFHNGKFYKKGSTVSLTPEQAGPLVAHKAVMPLATEDEETK